VIPGHLCGQSCDMAAIAELGEKYDFKIIEDASHAIGGQYKNAPIGNCKYSDITVFSFHPVKIITTAEGGACMTNDDALATKMNLARSHGVTRDEDLMKGEPDGPWYYEQVDLGYNYRMTDIQAALGTSQMKRIDEFVKVRNELSARYDQELLSLPLITPRQHDDCYSARHLYVIKLQEPDNHRAVFEKLRELGIGVNLHYIPVHTQPYFEKQGFKQGDFPNAEKYYQAAISIPLYSKLTHDEQDTVIEALKTALS